MKHGTAKTLKVGCILLALFFLLDAFAFSPQPVFAQNTVKATISIGNYPDAVTVAPNGAYAYVAVAVGGSEFPVFQQSGEVSVINTATNTVTATVTVGTDPEDVAVTPNGEYVYVTNSISDSVSVINAATNTVTTTITGLSGPHGVAVTPNGEYAYVTNSVNGTVSVISTATNTVTAIIPVGSYANSVAVAPNGEYAYVTNNNSGMVSVISTATNTVTTTVTVGNVPNSVAVTPNGPYAYVTNSGDGTVSVINALVAQTMKPTLGPSSSPGPSSTNTPAEQWEQDYGFIGYTGDSVNCLIQTSDGGYAFVGTSTPYNTLQSGISAILVKTDSSGTEQWQQQFGFAGALGLVQTSDGGYVLAGQDNDSSGVVLFKLDSSGNLQWNETLPFIGCSVMVPTSDGGFALAGTQNSEVWLLKLDSSGNVQWNNTYSEAFDRGVSCLIQSQDGGFVMMGSSIVSPDSEGSPSTLEMVNVNSAGTLLWSQAYDAGISSWGGYSIVQTSDGGYVISDNTNSSDSHLAFKIDQNGIVEWNQTYETPGSTSQINDVIETSDGGLAFAGWIQPGGITNIWAVKTDSSGNTEWTQSYGNTEVSIGGVGSKYYFGGNRIIESSDGSLLVAGVADLGSWYQVTYYLVKTQPFLPAPAPTTPPPSVPSSLPSSSATLLIGVDWLIVDIVIIVMVFLITAAWYRRRKKKTRQTLNNVKV
jgi:YVTN family beta-propeller protein